MDIVNLIMIAVGLSMDAFAVSICKGLSVQKLRPKHYILIGAWVRRLSGAYADGRLFSRKRA